MKPFRTGQLVVLCGSTNGTGPGNGAEEGLGQVFQGDGESVGGETRGVGSRVGPERRVRYLDRSVVVDGGRSGWDPRTAVPNLPSDDLAVWSG